MSHIRLPERGTPAHFAGRKAELGELMDFVRANDPASREGARLADSVVRFLWMSAGTGKVRRNMDGVSASLGQVSKGTVALLSISRRGRSRAAHPRHHPLRQQGWAAAGALSTAKAGFDALGFPLPTWKGCR